MLPDRIQPPSLSCSEVVPGGLEGAVASAVRELLAARLSP
jgi:hypothetical protein